ncbi:MAG: hypothetical protein Q9225_001233 [Loekoesia sp. 1 TL-2023]
MDWPNDMEPLLELPTNLTDKDMPDSRLGKRAEKAQESVLEDYNDLNKGVVSGFINSGSPCSLDFLEALMLNIKMAYDFLILDTLQDSENSDIVESFITTVLDETQVELKRLLQHPELFPDGTQQWFPQMMKLELRKVLNHVALQYAADEKKQAAHQEKVNEYRKRILPNYDDARTIWQQFLHGQAPGCGIPKNQMPTQGCTQMVPAACSLMACNRSEEHEGYAQSLVELVETNKEQQKTFSSKSNLEPTASSPQLTLPTSVVLDGATFVIHQLFLHCIPSADHFFSFFCQTTINKQNNGGRSSKIARLYEPSSTRDRAVCDLRS